GSGKIYQEAGVGKCRTKKVRGNLDQGGKKIKFKVIEALRGQFPVEELCHYLGVSVSGYYKFKKNLAFDKDSDLKKLVIELYEASDKQWGYRRIHMELQEEYKMVINHKRVSGL
ncbi:IS3 family transposase, partial [Mesobacillus subterraneus]|uniref:IS3 family transposase n=1 Tax=Mesobacillus subterraneus TaxID=285983 RepID=UPI00203DBC38